MAENGSDKGNQQNKGNEVGLPPGAKIGKYEVRERLGIGGQAIVYRCYDPLLDREVAIKQISSHLAADPEFLNRFRREAQILARVGATQPAVIDIHELLEDENGLFIVMEYVQGHTLERMIAESGGPIEPRPALQLIWRLAAAMHDVHRAGIVHRDLKPGNIIVAASMRPKITDFGLAAAGSDQTSVLMGTTKYMAPELFEGKPADARVDIYSLGFIAYEMLLGRGKFNEVFADVVRDKHAAAMRWMKWHGNHRVQAPPLHELNPSVPKPLSDIVAKMIAKDPDERFQSMEDLGRAIKQNFSPRARAAGGGATAGEAAAAKPREQASGPSGEAGGRDEGDELELQLEAPPTAPIPRKRLSRPVKIAMAAGVGLAIVIAGVLIGMQMGRQRGAAADAYRQAESLHKQGTVEYDRDKLAQAVEQFEQITRRHGGTEAAAKASVMVHMSRAYLAVLDGEWQNAAKEATDAEDALRNVQREQQAPSAWISETDEAIGGFESHRLNARAFAEAMEQARKEMEAGRFDAAAETVRQELEGVSLSERQEQLRDEFMRELGRQRIQTQFDEAVDRGDRLTGQGDYAGAAEAYDNALAALEEPEADDVFSPEELESMRSQVSDKRDRLGIERRYNEALAAAETAVDKEQKLRHLREAARIRPSDELTERMNSLQADIHYDNARRLRQQGELQRALEELQESLTYRDRQSVRQEMDELRREMQRQELVSAGDRAAEAGDLSGALEQYNQAAELGTTPELQEKINRTEYRIKLAEADRLRDAKRYDEAAAAYEQARQIRPEAAAQIDDRIETMERQRRYEQLLAEGDEYLEQQRWSEAIDSYEQAEEVMSTEEVQQKQDQANYLKHKARGDDAMQRGNYREALGYYRIAQNVMNTQEIQALIEEARTRAESEPQQ
ncbi:MAG: protein kinase domain-containing protein [Phycisphaerae bacterium]